MKYNPTDDTGKIVAARALAALGMVLDDLKLIAWDAGEFDDNGENISEDWDCAARALIKGMHAHGWSVLDVGSLILALVRVRIKDV
jgi:hypothetical protein